MNQLVSCDAIAPEISQVDGELLGRLLRYVQRQGMTVVEIGSLAGNGSTRLLCESVRPFDGVVYAVDPWLGSDNVPHHLHYRQQYGSLYPVFANNVFRYRGQDVVRPLKMLSLEAAKLFPDASLDLVFIDGHHGYSFVRADIEAWLPKVRPGGVLCGHDCDARYAAFDDNQRARIDEHCEMDIVHLADAPFRPLVHGGVVRAVHEVLADRAVLWFEECQSTIWSYSVPGRMKERMKDWLGKSVKPPRPEPTPWP